MAAQSIFSYKFRILCTEDDADTCDLLTFVLRQEGHEVVCIGSAEMTLRLAQAESFDLFIVDSLIPGMSGIQLTRKLREFNVKTPILFYTGLGETKDRAEAQAAGAQGYLVKPVSSDDLISEVARLVGEARIAHPLDIVVSDNPEKVLS